MTGPIWCGPEGGVRAVGPGERLDVPASSDRFDAAARLVADSFEGAAEVVFGAFTFDPLEAGSILVAAEDVVRARHVLDAPPHDVVTRLRYAGSSLPDHVWLERVADTLAAIEAGDVHKVVLARDVRLWVDGTLDLEALAARLHRSFPECYTFVVDGLVGASPELLVRRRGRIVESLVLAGSAARGLDGGADRALADELLGSSKERREHQMSVDSVVDLLGPLVEDIRLSGPEIIALANIQHLGTRVRAVLRRDPPTALEVAAALHPTAAVAGTPRGAALDIIGRAEGMSRRRYCGPVGWVDRNGDGEWAIALRCGEFDAAGGTVFAGGGIVAGSDPLTELEETRIKLTAMLSALEGRDLSSRRQTATMAERLDG